MMNAHAAYNNLQHGIFPRNVHQTPSFSPIHADGLPVHVVSSLDCCNFGKLQDFYQFAVLPCHRSSSGLLTAPSTTAQTKSRYKSCVNTPLSEDMVSCGSTHFVVDAGSAMRRHPAYHCSVDRSGGESAVNTGCQCRSGRSSV